VRRAIFAALALPIAMFPVSIATLAITTEPAAALSCSSPVHYAASSNTLYLIAPPPGGGSWTLTEIKQVCPIAPLTEVDPINQIWELDTTLNVQNGVSLQLHGSNATVPGDVNTLRLRSLSDDLPADVSSVTLNYGSLDVDSVTVTSWDDNANGGSGGPQTNYQLPQGAPSTDVARAYIRAESSLASDGVEPLQSTMTIENSTVEYLGYYASERYGVSYKTEGCSHTTQSVCSQVTVTGSETNSVFQYDYMGTYTWGASNMTFNGNQYYRNIMYGLDTHDVSRNLLIEYNHSSYNGDHGIICSQACSNLTITSNVVDHNGLVPWSGPDPDVDVAGQVHGIMLHRGVTNSVVENNLVYDQPNGAGVAIFDTDGDTVENNTITDNLFGFRLSVGASNNVLENNTVTLDSNYPTGNTPEYGVYTYIGSDIPTYNSSGMPSGNQFVNNQFNFNGMGSNIVKLSPAANTYFSGNSFLNPNGSVAITAGAGNNFADNVFATNQQFTIKGASGTPGGATITDPDAPLKVSVDAYSQANVVSNMGQVFTLSHGTSPSIESSSGSVVVLTTATVGTTSVVVTPLPLEIVPSSGMAQITAKISGALTTAQVTTLANGIALTLTEQGLESGAGYQISRGGVVLATVVANGSGVVTYKDGTLPSGTYTYTIGPS
jgi:parallel beta-helix repeat protein